MTRTCKTCGHAAEANTFPINNKQQGRMYYKTRCKPCWAAYTKQLKNKQPKTRY